MSAGLTNNGPVLCEPASTVGAALAQARALLAWSRTAALDAELLLADVLGRERPWVMAHAEAPLSALEARRFASLIARRARGEPVAYLLGRTYWYDLVLEVGPAVLVPRPETELLLERACRLARERDVRSMVDVGTGSGAVAIGLARCLPRVSVTAIDVSTAALQIARRNVARYQLHGRVEILQGNLIEPLAEKPDVIVANLPYLSARMMQALDYVVRHEPALALHGGTTGVELYAGLRDMLARRDWSVPLVIEIDPRQKAVIRRVFSGQRVELEPDYAGHIRTAVILPEAGD